MDYSKIISVTGTGGLFELISNKADGVIVRSLEDKMTKFISSRAHHYSRLESIEIFTVRENVNLLDVFIAMKQSSEKLPDYKNVDEVKNYFTKVFPDMDFKRVYASDMKKMVRWFNILEQNNFDFKPITETEEIKENPESEPAAPEEKTDSDKS
jgi:hypothetical protein